MNRELRRLTLGLLVGFVVIALSGAFWMIVQADSLLDRSDNLRRVIEEQRIRRGAIVDRAGTTLAFSEVLPDEDVERVYPYPEAAGAVGYYSYTYGAAGIEAAFDDVLRGADAGSAWDAFVDNALNRYPVGSDVRSTIDLTVQQAITAEMGSRAGAAVVVDVPSGAVRAMVSRPGFDPNQIDEEWDALREDEQSSPLLNRVTAGIYQPGGAIQTVMLSAILAAQPDLVAQGGYILNGDVADAQAPVQVNGLELTCLPGTPDETLTLAEAYAHACPAPFVAALGDSLTPERIWERLDILGLLSSPELAGFTPAMGQPAQRLAEATPLDQLVATVTGQSDLTVTPLQMVQVVAAIAGQGNGVPLHMVDAVRAPGSDTWEPVEIPTRRPALLRPDVASMLRLAMLQASGESSYVAQALRGTLVLYGHAAIAYAGPDATPYAWFIGFVDQPDAAEGSAIAAVVVIENESDPGVAAQVAGEAFQAAVNAQQQAPDAPSEG